MILYSLARAAIKFVVEFAVGDLGSQGYLHGKVDWRVHLGAKKPRYVQEVVGAHSMPNVSGWGILARLSLLTIADSRLLEPGRFKLHWQGYVCEHVYEV